MTTHISQSVGKSQCEAMEELLKKRSGEWVSMLELAAASGSMNVHSRVSDLRHRGMSIENRSDREDGRVKSFYRYTPSKP